MNKDKSSKIVSTKTTKSPGKTEEENTVENTTEKTSDGKSAEPTVTTTETPPSPTEKTFTEAQLQEEVNKALADAIAVIQKNQEEKERLAKEKADKESADRKKKETGDVVIGKRNSLPKDILYTTLALLGSLIVAIFLYETLSYLDKKNPSKTLASPVSATGNIPITSDNNPNIQMPFPVSVEVDSPTATNRIRLDHGGSISFGNVNGSNTITAFIVHGSYDGLNKSSTSTVKVKWPEGCEPDYVETLSLVDGVDTEDIFRTIPPGKYFRYKLAAGFRVITVTREDISNYEHEINGKQVFGEGYVEEEHMKSQGFKNNTDHPIKFAFRVTRIPLAISMPRE